MSITLMAAIWPLALATTDKIVLLSLADAANDDGVTWIAVRSRRPGARLDLLRKCSLSERAVQGALRRLEQDGHLSRRERPGLGVIYRVHPQTDATPAAAAGAQPLHPAGDAPPQQMAPTPAAAAGNPSITIKTQTRDAGEISSPPLPREGAGVGGRASALADDASCATRAARTPTPLPLPEAERGDGGGSAGRPRASRVADGFVPAAGGRTGAIVALWPPGRLAEEVERFVDHHRVKGTLSCDWQASWRSWVRLGQQWEPGGGFQRQDRGGTGAGRGAGAGAKPRGDPILAALRRAVAEERAEQGEADHPRARPEIPAGFG